MFFSRHPAGSGDFGLSVGLFVHSTNGTRAPTPIDMNCFQDISLSFTALFFSLSQREIGASLPRPLGKYPVRSQCLQSALHPIADAWAGPDGHSARSLGAECPRDTSIRYRKVGDMHLISLFPQPPSPPPCSLLLFGSHWLGICTTVP